MSKASERAIAELQTVTTALQAVEESLPTLDDPTELGEVVNLANDIQQRAGELATSAAMRQEDALVSGYAAAVFDLVTRRGGCSEQEILEHLENQFGPLELDPEKTLHRIRCELKKETGLVWRWGQDDSRWRLTERPKANKS